MGDVAYAPLTQADDIGLLANVFFRHGVFEEFALPAIAITLGGEFASVAQSEPLHLHDLWDLHGKNERSNVLDTISAVLSASPDAYIVDTPFWSGPSNLVAFLHPVKIGLGEQHRRKVKELYSKVFG